MKRNIAKAHARTMIYFHLFGKQEYTYLTGRERQAKRPNLPEHDYSRRLSTFWTWEAAKAAWDNLNSVAEFSPERKAMLEERLAQLKHHNSQGQG